MRSNLLLILILFPLASLMAQQRKIITGVVKNARGEPLSGVSVVESSKNGTTTDATGRYSLTLKSPSTKSVQFSYVGYLNRSISIEGKAEINIELKENESQNPLDEVIVVGTQQQNRRKTVASLS